MVELGTSETDVADTIIQCLELPEVPNVLLITPSDAQLDFVSACVFQGDCGFINYIRIVWDTTESPA